MELFLQNIVDINKLLIFTVIQARLICISIRKNNILAFGEFGLLEVNFPFFFS